MATVARALRLVVSSPSATQRTILAVNRRLLSITTEAAGAGDPAVHSGDPPSDDYAERPPKFSGAEEAIARGDDKHPSATTTTPSPLEETTSKKEPVPPFGGPSGKLLGSQELADPAAGSTFTQKRRWSTAPAGSDPLGDATPGDEVAAARKVREEDREYYRTHKPSPLAEVEFADTRKPVTRATDGGAEDRAVNDVPGTMVEDTADDSLARAEAMFREAASRGNPAWPHSRALAAMLARRSGEGGAAPWGS